MPRSRRLQPGRVIALTALCGFTVWACGGSDKEKIQAVGLSQGCTLNSECLDPLVCTFARCHTECNKDRDCPGEQRCVKGSAGFVCQLKVETACTSKTATTVCKGSQVCGEDGECRDTCKKDADCTAGQVCALSGECASSEVDKDAVDADGNIVPDTFVDPDVGTGTGSGGGSSTGKGGATGKGGGTTVVTGGAENTGGAGGEGPVSSGGTVTGAGGKTTTGAGGKGTVTSGGTTGSGGSLSTSGAGGEGGTPGPFMCPAGKGDCGGADPYDCETFLTLPTTCGACDVACMSIHGTSVCDQTTLKCVVSPNTCTSGYADCNKSGVDGCEVALNTDAENCGTCGRSCGGGKCTSGQCGGAVVFDPTGATTLSYNYTGDSFLIGKQLVKLNVSNGTEARTISLDAQNATLQGSILVSSTAIQSMFADTTNVYYALTGSPATVLYKPLNGTAATPAKTAVTMPDANAAKIMTANSTAFYMVNNYNVIVSAAKNLTGSGTTAAAVPITGTRSTISNLVVAGAYLYWIETPNIIYAASLGGGAPVAIDTTTTNGYYSYQSIATDGTYVYWTTYNAASSKIRRISAAVAPVATAVEDVTIGINAPSVGIALDATYVYYYQQQAVYRTPKDNSAVPQLLGNLNASPYFYNLFAVDDAYVYGTGSTGQILRVSKNVAAAQ